MSVLEEPDNEPGAYAVVRGGNDSVASAGYLLVHLVSREAMTSLVATQVVDHAEFQATSEGADAPASVVVGLLEPMRIAVRSALRARVRAFASRAPHVRVVMLPFSSRLRRWSVAWIAAAIARFAGRRAIVMHCRGEEAVLWARDLAARLGRRGKRVGIVADIRGAWPMEFLLTHGLESPASASGSVLNDYETHVSRLREALTCAHQVLTVSTPLAEWMSGYGAPAAHTSVVPCSVSRIEYSADRRATGRARLGISDDVVVVAYVGSIAPYQHVEDGALQFFRHALMHDDRIHLLALTTDTARFRGLLARAGVPDNRSTVMSVPQELVADYLCAADAGLLLRARSTVNAVSMPVKLGEYLSCGVPVIVSRISGWVTEIINAAGAGIAVSWFGVSERTREQEAASVIDQLRGGRAGFRDRALALCRERFVWSAHSATVRRAYAAALLDREDAGSHADRLAGEPAETPRPTIAGAMLDSVPSRLNP